MLESLLQPITAEQVFGQAPIPKEPRLVGDCVMWIEQRPHERGRSTALIRPWGRPELPVQELTPYPINLRTRVHEYGGGAVSTAIEGRKIHITWIDDCNGSLWYQLFHLNNILEANIGDWLCPIDHPRCLSRGSELLLANGLIDLSRNRWLGVMEKNEKDFLVAFSLDFTEQDPNILYIANDFLGYPVIAPNGNQLAWIEWEFPNMPWDISRVCWSALDINGELIQKFFLQIDDLPNDGNISFFQPIWLNNSQLLVSEDSSNWWNLIRINIDKSKNNNLSIDRNWSLSAEIGLPQWVYGMSTTSASQNEIFSLACKNGYWSLNHLSSDGLISKVNQPFDDLSAINIDSHKAVAIASNSNVGIGLLEVDLKSYSWQHTPSSSLDFDPALLSIPECFWFEGWGGESTHAWYYPPSHGKEGTAPLIVKSHSGPTAMASKGLNLGIQYWTSRGWGVVDVNYGGSTGFGRKYRNRLKSTWGGSRCF